MGRLCLAMATALLVCWAHEPAAAVAAPSTPESVAEDEIMQRLRRSMHATYPAWATANSGWNAASDAAHCSWTGVTCDAQGHVIQVSIVNRPGPPQAAGSQVPALVPPPPPAPADGASAGRGSMLGPLVPELAHLQWLQELELVMDVGHIPGTLPTEWGTPGAFPRLDWLHFQAPTLAGTLPDIWPGALPLLRRLTLQLDGMQSSLPASWGDPAALPALEVLWLELQLVGLLPPAWAQGFKQVSTCEITCVPAWMSQARWEHAVLTDAPAQGPGGATAGAAPRFCATAALQHTAVVPQPAAQPEQPLDVMRLPAEWDAAFPKAEKLALVHLGLEGPFPIELVNSRRSSLKHLDLSNNALTGTLPAALFQPAASQLELVTVDLTNNSFVGTLPTAWADSSVRVESLQLAGNNLSGPAFPPAWLKLGALTSLNTLDVSRNPLLSGTLPPSLPWRLLRLLNLAATGVAGSVPESWCPLFTRSLRHLFIKGTAIDPALPPCALKSLSSLGSTPGDSPATAGAGAATGHPTTAGFSAVALLLGTLAAGGAMGKLLWWRHKRRLHRYVPVQHGRMITLPQQQQQQLPAEAQGHDVFSPGQTPSSGAAGLQPTNKRERLTALITHALRSGREGTAQLPVWSGSGLLAPVHRIGASAGPSPSGGNSWQGTWRGSEHVLWPDINSLVLLPGELGFNTDSKGRLVVLGEGAHAMVYLASLGGTEVAAKATELVPGVNSQVLWQEVTLLHRCSHERIVPLYGLVMQGTLLILVMQLMKGGSLERALLDPETRHKLSWRSRGRQVAMDVAEALSYIHSKPQVIHNDLKPSNVLLTEDLRACVGDLGVAQALGSRARTAAGLCCLHAAPEQLMGERCSLAADMYSFGILLIELTTQKLVRRRGEWCMPHAPADCSQGIVALIDQCISLDPACRPTAAQALQRLLADEQH